jgi:hypothetical protein
VVVVLAGAVLELLGQAKRGNWVEMSLGSLSLTAGGALGNQAVGTGRPLASKTRTSAQVLFPVLFHALLREACSTGSGKLRRCRPSWGTKVMGAMDP